MASFILGDRADTGPQREPRFWLRREDPDNRPCGCPGWSPHRAQKRTSSQLFVWIAADAVRLPRSVALFYPRTYNQSVLVVISTNDLVGQILLNDRTSLPQTSSAGQLYNATRDGTLTGRPTASS